jgi:hypothetical protein
MRRLRNSELCHELLGLALRPGRTVRPGHW